MKIMEQLREKLTAFSEKHVQSLVDRTKNSLKRFFPTDNSGVNALMEIKALFLEELLSSSNPWDALRTIETPLSENTPVKGIHCFSYKNDGSLFIEFSTDSQSFSPVLTDEFNNFFTPLLLNKKSFISGDLTNIPSVIKHLFINSGIDSLVIIPLFVNSSLWGGLIFNSCSSSQQWHPMEIALFRSISGNLAIKLEQVLD